MCATSLRSGTSQRCGRAQVRSYRKERRAMDRESMSPVGSLWERTLCATNLRSDTPRRVCRAQGALPQTSRCGKGKEGIKADAQRGPALSPQRFGRVAQRFEVSPVYPRRLSHQTRPKRSGLSQHDAAGVIGHSLWVTFDAKLVPWDLLGQQEKSDSSGGSRSKRPPRPTGTSFAS